MKTKDLFKKTTAVLLTAGLSIAIATTSFAAESYDLVILNGRVMDPETKLDALRNVGVRDGKIAAITKKKSRARKLSMPKTMSLPPALSICMTTTPQRRSARSWRCAMV